MKPFLRLLCASPFLFAIGCALPERNNLNDSNLRPTARLAVTIGSNGEQVVSGERWQDLYVDVTDSSVPSGEIDSIVVELVDIRDEATPTCPLRPTVLLGTLDPRINDPVERDVVVWNTFANPCFELSADGTRTEMPVWLRATVHSTRGAKDSTTIPFTLVNAPPVADAGPSRWADPTWGPIAVFENRLHSDQDNQRPDPLPPATPFPIVDELTYHWSQIAGPAVNLDTSGEPVFDVDLSGGELLDVRYGASFRFQVYVCDPWECSEPIVYDANLRPAVWAATALGLMQLDGSFTIAHMFDNDVDGTPVDLSSGTTQQFAPSDSGMYMFQPGSNIGRHIRGDFTAVALPTLPAIFQDVVGTTRHGVAWIMVGPGPGPYTLLEVGPGESFVTKDIGFSQSMLTRTFLTQYESGTSLWAAGYEAGHFRFTVFPPAGGSSELHAYVGDALYTCLGDNELIAATADPDGGLWAVGDEAILRLGPAAEIIGCFPFVVIGDDGARRDPIVVPTEDGGSRLVYVHAPDFLSFTIRSMDINGVERIIGNVPSGSLEYDVIRNRIYVLSADGVASYEATAATSTFGEPIAFAPLGDIFPDYAPLGSFTQSYQLFLDRAGRPWVFHRQLSGGTARTLARLPESLSFARSVRDEAGVVEWPNAATIDPRTGNVWMAQAADATNWYAVAYNEFGPTVDDPIELPNGPTGIALYDGIRGLFYDPGDPAVGREPGMWVAYNEPAIGGGLEIRILRLFLTGAVDLGFGGTGELPAGGFPDNAAELFYGPSIVLDPTDGSLWIAIHDDDGAADGRLGEVYRLGPDGTAQRFSSISTLRLGQYNTIGTVNGLLVSGGNSTHIVRVSRTGGMTSSNTCFGGADLVGSVSIDLGTSEASIFCWVDSGPMYVPSYSLRWDVTSGLAVSSIRSPTVPIAVDPFFQNQVGHMDSISGMFYAVEGSEIRMYDRFLNSVGLYHLPRNVRYMLP